MIGAVILVLITLAITALLRRRWQRLQLREKMGIVGPPPNFIFGNIHQIHFNKNKSHPQVMDEYHKQYGKIFGVYVGPKLLLIISDFDMAKEILVKQFLCFVDRMQFPMADNDPASESVLLLTSQKWKTVRNALSPTFTANKLKRMIPTLREKMDIFLSICDRRAEEGKSFDIYNDFQALTLDVIGRVAFGTECNCQLDPNDSFLRSAQTLLTEASMERSKLIICSILFPELEFIWSFLKDYTGFGKAGWHLYNKLRLVLNHRKTHFGDFNGVDMLQLLLQQQREASGQAPKLATSEPESAPGQRKAAPAALSDDEILANCYGFLIAGHETTSTSLAYTAWLLAKHPEVQKKLQAEIDEKLLPGVELGYDLLHEMEYLDAVFHESLRLYPPVVAFITRTCIEPCVIHGIQFPVGVEVQIPVLQIHHDPDIWPEPLKFMPERFLTGDEMPKLAWMPFGDGPRNCIGMRFADMEFKMCIAKLLQRFTIQETVETEDPLDVCFPVVLMRPRNGVMVKLVPRLMSAKSS